MAKLINPDDYIGKKYGRLTVVEVTRPIIYKKEERRWFVCICDCGNIGIYRMKDVINGKILSCKCLIKEITANRNRKHDLTETPLHQIWCAMKGRCTNPTNTAYKNYGARGISVCDEWMNDFVSFYNWCIANGWKRGLQIDRENNNGSYSPENCRIVTNKVNCNNRRGNVFIEFNGERLTMSEWGDKTGLKGSVIYKRIYKRGWSIKDALTVPLLMSGQKISSIIPIVSKVCTILN